MVTVIYAVGAIWNHYCTFVEQRIYYPRVRPITPNETEDIATANIYAKAVLNPGAGVKSAE